MKWCLALAVFLASEYAVAQTVMQPLPPKPDVFSMLIGGEEAYAEDFPATVYVNSGGGRCTATLIGPEVLITAAHCVDDRGTLFFTLLTGEQHRARCDHHRDYDDNATADWALCKLETPATGIVYETLSMDRTIPDRSDWILLTGYGCTRSGGGGGNDGTLRIGFAEVIRTPRRGDWDIITRGDVALCFGDSGGPAFYTGGREGQFADRLMISVNSRGNIEDTSYLSKTLQNEVFSGWLKAWAADREVTVCGLSHSDGCRGGLGDGRPDDGGEGGGDSDDGGQEDPPDNGGDSVPIWVWLTIFLVAGVGAWIVNAVKGWFSKD